MKSAQASLASCQSVVRLFFVLGLLCLAQVAAAQPAPVNFDIGKRFASVWRIKGDVTASGVAGMPERKLREGDVVLVGERVRSDGAAEAVLRTDDAGAIAVRPGAEFYAERFAAEGKTSDGATMRIITGSLRVITGWIGHVNRANLRIVTPNATIGIRGTDHEPYVLTFDNATEENKPGTYDKVNRGGTTLEAQDKALEIDPGKVGFARMLKTPKKSRALMTILLPVLLDKVPDFYVPGAFDAELDQFSDNADAEAQKALEKRRKALEAAPKAECAPAKIGKTWVTALDRAIHRLDAPTIIDMFAPDVKISASVRTADGGMQSIELGRDDLAQSTVTAIKSLKNYKHRRISIDAAAADTDAETSCQRVKIKSIVIENGKQGGKPFRFESTEEYVIELRDGKWLAVRAETVQR